MAIEIGYIIAGIDLLVGLFILGLMALVAKRLRGGVLFYLSACFVATGLLFVLHAGIEVAGLGEELYAVSALVATVVLFFTVVIADLTHRMLGGGA